ncbi:MAG TPA: hypothetical protein PLD54_03620 [Candidatus Levybacteria bacterium]|nr:hypothetical protein [Candidatus Levybacteria bacterium]
MNRQSGQILLIVVLSMVVALSVGLSIASRTISNLQISRQSEESQRAFQAAEAGLERAVRQVSTGEGTTADGFPGILDNNANFNVEIKPEGGDKFQLNGGDMIERAVGLDVWMSNYPHYTDTYSGKVRLFWGHAGQSCGDVGNDYVPALEVLLLHGDVEDPQLYREVYDPCPRITGATTIGVVGDAGYENAGFQYQYRADFPSGDPMPSSPLIFKVIPIFNSTRIGIQGLSGDLPSQGSVITSTGTAGETVRKIQYFQSYPQIPNELFPYAIISQN